MADGYILEGTGVGVSAILPKSALTSLLHWHDHFLSSHSSSLESFLESEASNFITSDTDDTCSSATGVGSSHARFSSYVRFQDLFEGSLEAFLKAQGESGGDLFDLLVDVRERSKERDAKRRQEEKEGEGKEDGGGSGEEVGIQGAVDFVLAILDFENFERWMIKEGETRRIAREDADMMGL
jgi:hypothetical protein